LKKENENDKKARRKNGEEKKSTKGELRNKEKKEKYHSPLLFRGTTKKINHISYVIFWPKYVRCIYRHVYNNYNTILHVTYNFEW
jgi:hypothetical protein